MNRRHLVSRIVAKGSLHIMPLPFTEFSTTVSICLRFEYKTCINNSRQPTVGLSGTATHS